MKKRFGGIRIQIYLSVLSLLLYIFSKISVNLYSGSVFIEMALGWNIWGSMFLILFMTVIVTVTGGLAAVIYTDTVQAFVMIIGSITLTIFGINAIGGLSQFLDKYANSISNHTAQLIVANNSNTSKVSCGVPPTYSFRLLRPISDNDMPWLGFLLGQSSASIWYWCADQMMVQRALSAKDLSHAQGGTLLAGFIKLTPLFFMVVPGMISRILYPNLIACSDPDMCEQLCHARSGCSNLAYPKLVMNILPSGVRGLMLAVMLSALITDLTSIFNSSSTILTMDIYKKLKPNASNRELIIFGRIFLIVMAVISVLWVPVITLLQGAQLYVYIQDMVANVAPPVASVFILAVLWPRGNEKGAFGALCWGMLVGIVRFVLSVVYPTPACGDPDVRPTWSHYLPHYMYFAIFSFISTSLLMVVVSLASKRPEESQLRNTTFWNLDRTNSQQVTNIELDKKNACHKKDDEMVCKDNKQSNEMKSAAEAMLTLDDGSIEQTVTFHVRNIYQTKKQKLILNTFLVILIAITVGLFITMSTLPPLIESQYK